MTTIPAASNHSANPQPSYSITNPHLLASLLLHKKKEEVKNEVKSLKQQIQSMEKSIQKNLRKVFSTPLSHHAKHKKGPNPLTTSERIYRLLKIHPEGLKIADIAKQVHKSESHIYNCIRQNGNPNKPHIKPCGHRKWAVAE